jgi:selenocysteine lyase/cysteine desulfurase
MSFDPHEFRRHFPALKTYAWLNTAGSCPGAIPVLRAMREALDGWERGDFNALSWFEDGEESRRLFARLIGAPEAAIALVPTMAAGAATVAASLPAGAGRRIVVGEREFRSNLFPWMALRERGFEVEAVPAVDGVVSTEALAEAITGGTILVALSDVQFAQGYRVDLAAIAGRAREQGARLFLDVTQSLGALRLDLAGIQPDYVATHGYKWLLCPRGSAWLYVAPRHLEELVPLTPNWISVEGSGRFETLDGGPYREALAASAQRADFSPSWIAWTGARAGLEAHCLGLAAAFRAGAAERSLPLAPAELPSHLLALVPEDPAAAFARLKENGITSSVRGRYLRLGFHGYNTFEDMERALAALTAG